jgi:DNA helicase MCM9
MMAEHSLYSEDEKLDKELKMRQDIIDLFCPNLYDRDLVKLGVLLCLLGGVPHTTHNTRIRGQCHLLLVGEPGTGKSVVLQAATELVDRAFFVNAIGSTSAGLTVSHTKEKGAWMLEPGALVLADQGACCIDELNHMNKKDYPALLEAMEQQTISSAKAGIIGKLTCRTTVLAACNPILPGQKYNRFFGMNENTGLDPPLISRFDLILTLLGSERPE